MMYLGETSPIRNTVHSSDDVDRIKFNFLFNDVVHGSLASESHGAGDPARDLWWEGGQPSLAQRVSTGPGHHASPRQSTYSLWGCKVKSKIVGIS
jgi:hypothetical protein